MNEGVLGGRRMALDVDWNSCSEPVNPREGAEALLIAQNGATFGATTEGTARRQEGSPEIRGRILNPNPTNLCLGHPSKTSKPGRPAGAGLFLCLGSGDRSTDWKRGVFSARGLTGSLETLSIKQWTAFFRYEIFVVFFFFLSCRNWGHPAFPGPLSHRLHPRFFASHGRYPHHRIQRRTGEPR